MNSNTELQLFFNDKDFVLATQRQIIKDFAKFDLFFRIDYKDTPFSQLETEHFILEKIRELENKSEYSQLMQLFYVIDLPESEVRSSWIEKRDEKSISNLILLREAYKVFLRSKFSK